MNISIQLNPLQDANGQTYYIANKLPNFSLDLRKGYVFFVFISDKGVEDLQIGSLDPGVEKLSYINVQTNRKLKFRIYPREDKNKNIYYLGKIKLNATLVLDPSDSSFMVFTSIEGSEEIQIVGQLIHHD